MIEPGALRGFLSPDVVAGLRCWAECHYARLDAGLCDDAERVALKWGGLALAKVGGVGAPEFRVVVEALRARLPEARILEPFTVFRRITRKTYIYWHMDADGTGSHAQDPVWNCWVPLQAVGWGGSPSLEIMVNSGDRMRGFGPDHPGERSDSWVEANFPDAEVLTPRLAAGDAFVFSHWLLHRTQPIARLSGPRIGLECRFTTV